MKFILKCIKHCSLYCIPLAIPVIIEQPESKKVGVNEKLELRCFARCIPEPPDYQWWLYNGRTTVPIRGAKSWRLSIDKVTVNHTGQYCCRVQNRRKINVNGYATFSQYAQVLVTDCKHPELGTSFM